MRNTILIIIALCILYACTPNRNDSDPKAPLPFYGHHDTSNGDTIYYHIPDFSFINQDSQQITNASLQDKIYVVDFFFTSCPTICPKVKKQMLRIHDRYKDDRRVLLVSHTIDTKRDSVPKLKKYAGQLEVSSDKWHFVTGDHDHIYEMADAYFIVAQEDEGAPGGFDHSGRIILVDGKGHVRGNANGVDAESVTQFFDTIDQLLDESS